MATANSMLDLASRLAQLTGHAFVVFAAHNGGGSQNWARHFESMDLESLEEISETDGTVAIEYDTIEEGRQAFETFAREATENYTSIIGGEIVLVTRTGENRSTTKVFEIDATEYPVFRDGRWHVEIAANRL